MKLSRWIWMLNKVSVLSTSQEHSIFVLCLCVLLPHQTHLASKWTKHSHMICSDAFSFTWNSLVVFSGWKVRKLQNYKLINWFGPKQTNILYENTLKHPKSRIICLIIAFEKLQEALTPQMWPREPLHWSKNVLFKPLTKFKLVAEKKIPVKE